MIVGGILSILCDVVGDKVLRHKKYFICFRGHSPTLQPRSTLLKAPLPSDHCPDSPTAKNIECVKILQFVSFHYILCVLSHIDSNNCYNTYYPLPVHPYLLSSSPYMSQS